MSDSKPSSASPNPSESNTIKARTRKSLWRFTFLLSFLAPVLAALILYQLDSFEPAPLPTHEFTRHGVFVPRRNPFVLRGSEMIGVGQLLGPEDFAYDAESHLLYTGCADGWIKRVTVNESVSDMVIENWVNTGGRPLGLVLGQNKQLIIADADKGLLKVTSKGVMKLLTNEAEGLAFKLTDGVDITQDGMIYFTDASYKYSFKDHIWDILEGKPHGRLLSYDPSTEQTKVLVRDLYFPNGVAVSPDQNFIIFCETAMRRCKKYYIKGPKEGAVDKFIDDIPGFPDNILYDGEGLYWIALATAPTLAWDLAQRYPFIRKVTAIMERYIGRPHMEKNGGFLAVDIEGKPSAHYYDPGLSMVSSGLKIGDHLFGGSIVYPFIIRINLARYPAVANT